MPEITLTKMLSQGIRPDDRLPASPDYARQYDYAKPTQYGLRPYQAISALPSDATLTGASISKIFPHPQLWIGREHSFLLADDKIMDFNKDTGAVAVIGTFAYYGGGSNTITSGGIWHTADFGEFLIFTNGTELVFYQDGTLKVAPTNVSSVSTLRGRTVWGGFDDTFWHTSWETYWDTLISKGASDWGFNLVEPGQNWVYWSSIGGGDIRLLMDADHAAEGLSASGGFDSEDPLWHHFAQRNEMGMMPMPWQGQVQKLLPLGKHMIVYGEDGISALFDAPPTHAVPTLGLQHLLDIGILNRGSVGGDNSRHVFVDNRGVLWTITADLQVERLGYQHIFADFGDMFIGYDPDYQEFYLADTDEGYILTKTGLAKIPQRPMALFRYDGLLGVFESDSPSVAEIISHPFNFGTGLTTITTVQLIGYTGSAQVALDWRYGGSGAFTRTSFETVNDSGFAYIKATGFDFRLVIKDTYSTATIDAVVVATHPAGKLSIKDAY